MSFYSDASLVLIPSGYKDQKVYSAVPTDGSGDLVFSRASSATRVASNGLIEKVRTNLILQSNTFSTTWVNSNSTETSGQAGYDGTNNAWLLDKTGTNGYIGQTVSYTGLYTQSIYVKAGTSNWLAIQNAGLASSLAYFDLQNGVIGSAQANVLYHKIESIGGGWYRCSAAYNGASGQARFFVADSDNVTSGTSGNILIQAAQFEASDIATDYIATTTAAVSVGPVANVPRLDYLNSSCPRLLLEPQRSNLALWSENFDNAGWTNTGATITANNATSPDGYINADTITAQVGQNFPRVSRTISLTNNTNYVLSVFVKKIDASIIRLRVDTSTSIIQSSYNIDTLNVINIEGTGGSIEQYPNGWVRASLLFNSGSNASSVDIRPIAGNVSDGSDGFFNGKSVISWGAQLELGAYATSYIPTLSTSVTRVADAASKTGISSLIGQTEGTLFVEFEYQPTGASQSVAISDGTSSNRLDIRVTTGNVPAFIVVVGGVVQASISSAVTITQGQRVKVAAAYKNNDFVLYQNGALVASATSGTIGGTLSRYGFDLNGGQLFNSPVNQALLFPTRLTNAQLAELTTL
jgi:hypothetical protein